MVQTAFCFFKMLKQKTYKAANHTFIKNLAVFFQNIKFCKAQSGLNFPRFSRQALFARKYLKIQKTTHLQ